MEVWDFAPPAEEGPSGAIGSGVGGGEEGWRRPLSGVGTMGMGTGMDGPADDAVMEDLRAEVAGEIEDLNDEGEEGASENVDMLDVYASG